MAVNHSLATHTLDNGLTIFTREKHDAPVASFWVWYRVGSRNEVPGLTGVSHWVEHMQFKGTPTIAKGAIFREVSRNGGSLNAMTSQDWTAYYETLPSDRIDLALDIESDRMSNSLFDPDEAGSERTVILSERQGAENRPTYLLAEEVYGTAFQASPYRHMVIGYENDLRRITRDDLYNHYQRFYMPNNAFIAAAGDFDTDELLKKIEGAFGGIPAGPPPPPMLTVEPPQRGERTVTLRRPSPAAYLLMAYRMPEARHPDIPALLVADSILSGAKPMGMGGGSAMGRSARLYRALVAGGLARSVSSSAGLNLDANLWTFSSTALPGVEPAQVQTAIEEQIERLKREPVPEEEFRKARKQIRAQYIYSQQTVTSQAFWIGQMEIVDRAARIDTLADEVNAVTGADVMRVATTWLQRDQRTVGWQLPEGDEAGGGGDEEAQRAAAMAEPPRVWYATGVPMTDESTNTRGFARTELRNGIVLLTQARPDEPTVSATVRIHAGQGATGETRAGLPAFVARMLNRGTTAHSFEAFNEAVDSLGAVIDVDAGRDDIDVSLLCLCEDLDAVLTLVSEIIRQPTFPGEELERVRQQTITGLKEQESDTRAMASQALRELLYPEGHPYRLRVSGEIGTVSGFTRDDLVAYHRKYVGPAVTIVSLVGGVADLDAARAAIERHFGDWDVSVPAPRTPPAIAPPPASERAFKEVRGKSQADVVVGYPTLPRASDDYHALNMANIVLGQLGLMGRLGATVRDEQGLAYYVYSSLSPGIENSQWSAAAGVDPGNVERALAGIVGQLRQLRETEVSEAEINDAKSYLTGRMPLTLESPGGVVDLLLMIERFGLGLDYLDRYPEIVRAQTRPGLQEAAARHLDPDRLAIGVAGPNGKDSAGE